jgi:hypothetical protein
MLHCHQLGRQDQEASASSPVPKSGYVQVCMLQAHLAMILLTLRVLMAEGLW